MCIIQGEVERVAATNILISGIKGSNSSQLVVYSNKVDIKTKPVAMILPFPNFSKKNQITVIPTTKDDSDIFIHLNDIFPDTTTAVLTNSLPDNYRYFSRSTLPVSRAGSYQYSIVNSIRDFRNIDNTVFQLHDKNIEVILNKYYKDFGFVVCIIDKSAAYSPFMYITEKLPDGMYFIPTRHYHGHISEQENWDHRIYILGTTDPFNFTDISGITVLPAESHFDLKFSICSKYIPRFHKTACKAIKLEGSIKNGDIRIQSY